MIRFALGAAGVGFLVGCAFSRPPVKVQPEPAPKGIDTWVFPSSALGLPGGQYVVCFSDAQLYATPSPTPSTF
jgi:hypothetical protein